MATESIVLTGVTLAPSVKPRPPAALKAPPTESLSPFIEWSEEERDTALEPLLEAQGPSLLGELLVAPEAIARRLADPAQAPHLVQVSLGVLVGTTAFSGALLAVVLGRSALEAAVRMPLSLLIAAAAALAPIAAVSIVVGVRVPWSRLAGTLVAALATGALAASAVTPFAVVLHRLDPEWAGPLAMLECFLIAGVVAGRRTRQLLLTLATENVRHGGGEGLAKEAQERVALLARVATVLVGFTTFLAIWSLRALG